MTRKGELSLQQVKELLSYDEVDGRFYWNKPRTGCSSGSKAGGITFYGYWKVSLCRKNYLGHRLAWLMHYGRMPDGQLDHINGDRLDNRISNLRMATASQNQANKMMRKDNTSGVKGVTWCSERKKWQAGISFNRKYKLLGRFDNIEDAAAAYESGAKELFGEFARTERRI